MNTIKEIQNINEQSWNEAWQERLDLLPVSQIGMGLRWVIWITL
jgi:hypothetical protein